MARNPSASEGRPGSGNAGQRGGEARPDNATAPRERTKDGAMEADPVVEGSDDPWAEADAPHPDENAMDAPDEHPQPEDEQKRNPDA
jgi:hypothetical protein